MKLFLIRFSKILGLTILLLLVAISALTYLLRNRIDPYYVKLVSHATGGIILGDSRALQGLDPEQFDFNIDNFAFTIGHSPFDKSYIKLIQKKVGSGSNNQHIISVDPWSLINDTSNKEDRNPFFSEKLQFPLLEPNFEYIYKYIDLRLVTLLKLFSSSAITSDKGWLRQGMDSNELFREYPRRVKEKVENYKRNYPFSAIHLKSSRVQNLLEIIRFLKKSGRVVIVRLPVSREMMNLENARYPGFNSLLEEISTNSSCKFIDLTDMDIQTTDGNHIWYKEVARVSSELNLRIKKQ